MNESESPTTGGWGVDSAIHFGFVANWMSFKTLGSRLEPRQLVVGPTAKQTSLLKIENPNQKYQRPDLP